LRCPPGAFCAALKLCATPVGAADAGTTGG